MPVWQLEEPFATIALRCAIEIFYFLINYCRISEFDLFFFFFFILSAPLEYLWLILDLQIWFSFDFATSGDTLSGGMSMT